MENKKRIKAILLNIGIVILATISAILAHALIPGQEEMNADDFDSIFVKTLGFPVVATTYFLLLFTHCAIIVNHFGEKSGVKRIQVGLRFGLSFALIYLVAMQEVVVSASPFTVWGMDFVRFQLAMGLSDAIPAFLLCLIIAYFTFNKDGTEIKKYKLSNNLMAIIIISVIYTIVRIMGYMTGIIGSDFAEYAIPSFSWTLIFGLTLGFIYVYLHPIYSKMTFPIIKLAILTIGLNWIIFNCFIGLIFDGLLPQMLLRSIIDTAIYFIAIVIVNKISKKSILSNNN